MNENHVKEVFSDQAFVKSLLEMETTTEVQSALKEKNIDVTEDEIITLRDKIIKLAERTQNGEELSPEELDEAAGGVVSAAIIFSFMVAGVVSAAGAAIATGAGLVSGALVGSRRW